MSAFDGLKEKGKELLSPEKFNKTFHFQKKDRIENKFNDALEAESIQTFAVCPKCKAQLDAKILIQKKYVCMECGYNFRLRASNRIQMVADTNSYEPWFEDVLGKNPLNFEGYEEKLDAARKKTKMTEAVTIGKCRIYDREAVLGVMDAHFLMGSMGEAVGERITRGIERATQLRLPVFLFCCSGGARMQEGIISLMQMAKTSAAVKRHSDAGLFFCTILTDPTTGGVTASFASLGDIILAEPGALIGFAGARVIKQTMKQELPAGFQTAEFLLKHGFLDGIVDRKQLRKLLLYLIITNEPDREGKYGVFYQDKINISMADSFQHMGHIIEKIKLRSRAKSAWDKVCGVRQITRPSAEDYIRHIFTYFVEAHGDRAYGDDGAILGGIALLDGQPVTVIADLRGRTLQECQTRNFGMPMPEGYRKALRLMKQAEKFNRPVITFVNTSGAFCGVEAEQRGQGEAIARNLMEMSGLKVPVLSIMIGEGGSGGALGTAVANEVWMMENATYSILSPEGFAAILWKDGSRAQEASAKMRITAQDLKELGVIDKIIPEFGEECSEHIKEISDYMKKEIKKFLLSYNGKTGEEIARERYERFRKY